MNLPLLLALFIGLIVPVNSYLMTEARADAETKVKLDRLAELIADSQQSNRRLADLEREVAVLRERRAAR